MQILADTSILLRLAEPAHLQHASAANAYEVLVEHDHQLVVVPQVVYEFWTVVTRPRESNGLGFRPETAQSLVDGFFPSFQLLRDERAIYERWKQLVVEHSILGKQSHDARLVAAMLRHGVTHLLIFNTAHFLRYDEINTVDPSNIDLGALSI
jgi:predicted nucleic acid-binding protein